MAATICLVDPDTLNLFDANTIYLDCPPSGPTPPEPGIAVLPWGKGPFTQQLEGIKTEVHRHSHKTIHITVAHSSRMVTKSSRALAGDVAHARPTVTKTATFAHALTPQLETARTRTTWPSPPRALTVTKARRVEKVATDRSRAWVAARNREEEQAIADYLR